jgi:small subunit ribosomal protein S2
MSATVYIRLPADKAERLIWAARHGDLADVGISSATLVTVDQPQTRTPARPAVSASDRRSDGSLVRDLIEAGIHFGQRASSWNPKMAPFIYGKRNGIHIIDIKETVKGLLRAEKFITKIVSEGKDVCFVGTKRQAKEIVKTNALDVGMHFVTERWLGGTLTNFRTIRSRLKRLEELEAIEQGDNFASYSKKMESQLRRELEKMRTNLDGIRKMDKIPGAIIAVDVKSEITALKEARKLGVATICLIDTDGDPELVDIPIPGNDDSMRSIDVILRELCAAVVKGKQARKDGVIVREKLAQINPSKAPTLESDQPRRSRRAQFRADDPEGDGGGAAERTAAENTYR